MYLKVTFVQMLLKIQCMKSIIKVSFSGEEVRVVPYTLYIFEYIAYLLWGKK